LQLGRVHYDVRVLSYTSQLDEAMLKGLAAAQVANFRDRPHNVPAQTSAAKDEL
jgi:hypothetical protein